MANRFLSNIKINDSYTLPSADGTNGQIISTDGSGNLSFIDNTGDNARSIVFTVKNISGGNLTKGTVVHASPSATPPSGNVIEVIKADNDVSGSMPAIGVLNETLANEAEGDCVMMGSVSGIDTSAFSVGDELYVDSSPGAFTATKPTGTSNLIQKIGIVIKSHASNGLIEVFGAGRSNDVPNQIARDIQFSDGNKLSFGNDNDLRIHHADGSDSIITKPSTGEGNLIIQNAVTDQDIIFRGDNGAGSVTAYFRIDGSAENTAFSKNTKHGDGIEAIFGGGNDLKIYHTADTGSYVQNTKAIPLIIDQDGAEDLEIKSNRSVDIFIDKNNDDTNTSFNILSNTETFNSSNVVFEVTQTGAVIADASLTLGGSIDQNGGNNNFTGSLYVENNAPVLRLTESDATNTPAWWVVGDGGNFSIRLNNTGNYPMTIVTNATNDAVTEIQFKYDLDINADIDIAGDILPTTDSTYDLGSTSLRWANVWADNINGGTPVNGSGTANDVAMWSDSDTLTDAPIAISGNDATFANDVTVNGELIASTLLINGTTNREFYIDTTNPDHLKKNQNLVLSADPDNSDGSTVIAFHIDGSEKAILNSSGDFSAITLTLTDGNDDLTFTQSSDDWTINNAQQDNGITIYDGTAGVGINYNGTEYFKVNTSGVYVPDNIDFYVDTNLLFVDATNNLVGIGKEPSTYKLDVNGKIASNNYIIAGLGNGGTALTHNDGGGNANVTFNHFEKKPEQNGSAARIEVNTDNTSSTTDAYMSFELSNNVTANTSTNLNEIMRLTSSGRVGIGTNSPAASLEINDSIAGIAIDDIDQNSTIYLYAPGDGYSGGLGTSTLHDLTLATNNTDRVFIKTSGRVGIGNSSPSSLLDVAGRGRFTNLTLGTAVGQSEYGFPATDGSANQILQTDGSGALSWVDLQADNDWTISGNDIYSANNGRVGIGTSSPEASLHIVKDTAWIKITSGNSIVQFGPPSAGTGTAGIGTISNDDFPIFTYNQDRIMVKADGKVGIGTDSPEKILDIRGANNNSPTVLIRNWTTASGADDVLGSMLFYNHDASSGNGGRRISGGVRLTAIDGYGKSRLEFTSGTSNPTTSNNDDPNYSDNSIVRMVIDDAGDIGIGTIDPNAKIEVIGDAKFSRANTSSETRTIKIEGARETTVGEYARIDFDNYDNGSSSGGSPVTYTGARISVSNAGTGVNDGSLLFSTNNNNSGLVERMRITDEGKVGIGEDDPTAALHILSAEHSSSSAYGLKNKLYRNTDDGFTYGFHNEVDNDIGGKTYGFYNKVNSVGNQYNYGIFNSISTTTTGTYAYADYSTIYAHSSSFVYGDYISVYANNATTVYGIRTYVSGTNATTKWAAYFLGDSYTSAGIWTTSDKKLKTKINLYDGALNQLSDLPVYSYYFNVNKYPTMNFSEMKQYGILAQELEKIFPEMVNTSDHEIPKEGQEASDEKIEIKSVNYIQLIPITIKAIQEQQAIIEDQQKQIDELKKLVESLISDK